LEKIFLGRIFGPDSEVRWLRDGTHWSIWHTRESDHGEPAESETRDYFLWGVYSKEKGQFAEDRIPNMRDYLKHVPQPASDQDRAYIQIVEYSKAHSPVSAPKELMEQLNEPRLFAHRFVKVLSGRSEKTESED
jgi:hypothetical protein